MNDPRFSSSFIPKSPVVGVALQKDSMGLFQAVAGLIFFLSVASIGGIFAYKKYVENQIGSLKSELAIMESQLDRKEIERLATFDRKLMAVRELIDGHVAVSNFLEMLEANTAVPVRFTSLKYNAPPNQNISVQLEGKTDSYRVISEQEKVFLKNPNTVSIEFRNLNTDTAKRETSFIMNGVFNKQIANFNTISLPAEDAGTTTPELEDFNI